MNISNELIELNLQIQGKYKLYIQDKDGEDYEIKAAIMRGTLIDTFLNLVKDRELLDKKTNEYIKWGKNMKDTGKFHYFTSVLMVMVLHSLTFWCSVHDIYSRSTISKV